MRISVTAKVNPNHLPESVLSRRGLRRRYVNATSLHKVNSNTAMLPNNKRRENLKKCTFSDIRMFGLILTDNINHTFQDTDVDTDRVEQIRRKRRRRLDTPPRRRSSRCRHLSRRLTTTPRVRTRKSTTPTRARGLARAARLCNSGTPPQGVAAKPCFIRVGRRS